MPHIPSSELQTPSGKLHQLLRGNPEYQSLKWARLHATPSRPNQCHPDPNPIVAERTGAQARGEIFGNIKCLDMPATDQVKPIVLNQMKHNFYSIYVCSSSQLTRRSQWNA